VASRGKTLGLFFAMYAWFEVWFYVTHRLMHRPALRALHAHHHVSRVTGPLTSLSFSLSERAAYQLGILLGFAAIGPLTPVPAATSLLFFVVTYALNVLIHSNGELLPARVLRGPLRWVLDTATFHAMHHARGSRHYGFTTAILDHVLGTAWADYPPAVPEARDPDPAR